MAADGSRHLETLLPQSGQKFRQIELHAGIAESGQEASPIQHMVFRTVDPDGFLTGHMAENGQRIGFLFFDTGFDDGLGPLFQIVHAVMPHFIRFSTSSSSFQVRWTEAMCMVSR